LSSPVPDGKSTKEKEMNIGFLLTQNAGRYPENTAIVYRGQRFTYRELNERANRMGHHLIDLGVEKGDRVGFMFYNSNQFAEIYYATQKIGAISVPLNFRMVPREVKWILDNARCRVFAYGEACAQQVDPVKNDLATVEHLLYSGRTPPSGEHHFEAFTSDGPSGEPEVTVAFEDRAHIQFTGGTTGFPKGAVHTHRSSVFTCASALISMQLSEPTEVQLNQVPMFHNTGLNLLNMNTACGGTYVIVETFDPVEILQLIAEERASLLLLMPPTTYIRLMDTPNLASFDTSSVTRLITSAGALSKQIVLRLFDTFPNAILLYGWGLTETGPGGTLHRITRSTVENEPEKVLSIGVQMPFVEVRLVDEQGREVPVGETGEAINRGPLSMEGYFDQPELTAQTIKDGWVHTGDLLRRDQDGYFYFVDRKKDMIKSGGENVFAVEVEGVILAHQAVENCAVIGVPHPKFQEGVMAVLKLREGQAASEEQIIEHCKQHLSSYKKPLRVLFVETLPVSGVGKVQKFKLREQYRDTFVA
jgi:acyl-CoA synthetase (AMP-forming)/AMP-acid ligase II